MIASTSTIPFSRDVLRIDAEVEVQRITDSVKKQVAGPLRRKGRALPGPFEPDRAGAVPAEHFAGRVRNRNKRVVEGRLDMGDGLRHRAPDLAFSTSCHRPSPSAKLR